MNRIKNFIAEVNEKVTLSQQGMLPERELGIIEYIYHEMFIEHFGFVPEFKVDEFGKIELLSEESTKVH